MSDTIPTSDPAIDLIDEQIAGLNTDIAANARRVQEDTNLRDRLLAIRATLARKLRPRKPRVTTEAPANDTAEEPRPSVFAVPGEEAA